MQFFAERRQCVRLDPMLARQPADVEQPRLDAFELAGIERQGLGGPADPVFRLARLDQRAVKAGQCFSQ